MDDPTSADPIDEELEFHLGRRAEEYARRGLTPDEARCRALSRFGDLESTRQYCRRQSRRSRRRRRRRLMFDESRQDLKSAFRQIRKSPTTSVVIILTLALGIGANTAIFSVVEAALLRSAPVADPESLVALWTTCRRGDPRCSSSYLDIQDYRDRSSTLADLAYYAASQASLGDESGSRIVSAQLTSGNFFDLLGLRPAHGRLLTPSDDVRGGALVTVLSYDLWREQFGADPDIVGQAIRLNAAPYEVVGVAPAGFRGLRLAGGADVYTPFSVTPELGAEAFEERGMRWIDQLIGRMAPGATVEQVRSQARAISDQLAAEDPDARGPRSITVDAAEQMILPIGNEDSLRRFVLVLLTVVGLTLLLTCANLANLQLARAASRRRELAVRVAIGASRGRLSKQIITESVVLSLLGGLAGLALGPALLGALARFELPGGVSVGALAVGLDARVLLFTLVIALASGILFGLGPALASGQRNVFGALAAGDRGSSGGPPPWLRGALISVQMALSLVLLAGAMLFLQALRTGLELELGFDGGDDLVLATVDLSLTHYEAADAEALLSTLELRMTAMPGVAAFAAATRVPLMRGGTATMLERIDGYQPAPDEELRLEFNQITPGFFTALGLPLVAGSVFAQGAAVEGTPGPLVINADMAQRWWPDRQAVGGSVYFFGSGESPARVLGVAANTKWDDGMLAADYPFAYLPLTGQVAASRPVTLMVRSAQAETAAAGLRGVLRELDPEIALMQMSTLGALRSEVLMPQSMGARLLGGFAALALLLSAVGVYGVVGHSVGQRTRELGIRMALGADRRRIVRAVAGAVTWPIVAGIAAGLVGAVVLSGAVRAFLYGIRPADPLTLGGVVGLLAVVTALAAWLPARRAARIDPVRALSGD